MKNFVINATIILAILLISLNLLHLFLYSSIDANAIVVSEELNIRSKAAISDETSDIIITLHKGDELEFLGLEEKVVDNFKWARVKVALEDGSIVHGYCVYAYILVEEEPTTSTEAATASTNS